MADKRRDQKLDLTGLTAHANAILRAEERPPDTGDTALPPVDWAEVRSLRGASIVLRVVLAGWVPFSGVAITTNAAQRSLLARIRDGSGSVRWSEVVDDTNRVDLVNHVAIGLLAVTAFCWLLWFFLAYTNLRPLALPQRWSCGWALGAWFVPVLCWWRPKQLADDVWASVDRARRADGRAPSRGLVTAWWATWIATFVAAFIANGANSSAERTARGGSLGRFVDEALQANALYTVRAALLAVTAVLAILVVRAITRAQAKPVV